MNLYPVAGEPLKLGCSVEIEKLHKSKLEKRYLVWEEKKLGDSKVAFSNELSWRQNHEPISIGRCNSWRRTTIEVYANDTTIRPSKDVIFLKWRATCCSALKYDRIRCGNPPYEVFEMTIVKQKKHLHAPINAHEFFYVPL